MKVIMNRDLSPLGEEGDVRDVARGYARNYLLPKGFALPYTDRTVKLFESRREEIEARKAAKRQDAAGLKEKLEALDILIVMPAGANGRLYGAVTNQLVSEELAKAGFPVERKRVELPGTNFKNVGKYKALVKLFESAVAEVTVTVQAQEIKTGPKAESAPRRGRRRDEEAAAAPAEAETAQVEAAPAENVPAEEAAAAGDGVSPAEAEAAAEVDAAGDGQP